ncbi:MAG: hypothetical protein J0M26_29265 [Planctomycetes bacterium]|nr:hypothetical protein [Planctomycetota bacterium]
MSLSDFLGESSNSHAKEEIFNYRLLFDLKVAAAVGKYHLQTYYSDVDHDGFDVIFDDTVNLRKVQLKTVGSKATTANWEIHKCILRPIHNNCEELGFDFTASSGSEGGAILIQYETIGTADVEVKYYFTDIYLISAVVLGLLPRNKNTIEAAERVRNELTVGTSTEKVSVPKGLFLEVASPQHLLCMIGLRSTIPESGWQRRIRNIACETWGPKGRILPDEILKMKADFPNILSSVTGRCV